MFDILIIAITNQKDPQQQVFSIKIKFEKERPLESILLIRNIPSSCLKSSNMRSAMVSAFHLLFSFSNIFFIRLATDLS